MTSYFIAPDAHGDLYVWRERGETPVPVLAHRDLADDPEVWDILAAAIEAVDPFAAKCPTCKGEGEIDWMRGYHLPEECPDCKGTGEKETP